MTPERFQAIRGAFESVVSLPPTEQAESLRALGTHDAELVRELEALLAAHQRRGSFIEAPAACVLESRTSRVSPLAGTWIGPYQLLDLIGEGGMGQVWRAEQTTPIRRIVAIKLIKAGMDTHEVVGRFESERQALALMEHPAIAKVFDAGTTPKGHPYFAMEYVAGVPINVYCDLHRMTISERLKLFIHVCEGVQHAHQKSIIHRDLKPSNILVTEVDDKPVPKIIDFGVARAMSQGSPEATMLTRVGAVLGSPDYMSPEQASGGAQDLDTRADVYSLGVVLYELISGALPLELRGLPMVEILRRVSETDAPRPSDRLRMIDSDSAASRNRRSERAALISELRGDLDAIALKCIERDRRLRYNSPADLAGDISRYLSNEPVTARRASALYFARKYIRRNRTTVAAVAIVLILTAAFGFWQAAELRRLTRERDRADRIAQFMVDMFRNSDPIQSRGSQVTARQILDRASSDIGKGLASDPELQAQLMNVMGRVYLSLGLYTDAESLFRRSTEIDRRVLGTDHLETAQSMHNLAYALTAIGRRVEGQQLNQQVLAIRRRRLGEDHPDTLKTLNNLAVGMVEAGRYRDAAPLLRAVFEARRRRLGPEDPATLISMGNLGDALHTEGQLKSAETVQRGVFEIRRRVLGADHPDTLTALSVLAETLYDEGRYAEAEVLNREVFQARKRVLGPEHPYTLISMIAQANLLENKGHLAEAERINRAALKLQRKVLGAEHMFVMQSMNNLAGILAKEDRTDEAERLDREVVAVRARVLGPTHPETLVSCDRLAFVLALKGSYAEAESIARKTRDSQASALGPEHPETARTTYTLACIAAGTGRAKEALALLRDAVDHGLGFSLARGIGTDPALKPLHTAHEFQSLVTYARQHALAMTQPQ